MREKIFLILLLLGSSYIAYGRIICNVALFKEFLNFTKYTYSFDIGKNNACPFGEYWINENLNGANVRNAYDTTVTEPNLLSYFDFIAQARVPCQYNNIHRVLHKNTFNVTFAVSFLENIDEIRVYVVQQSINRPITFEILNIPTNVTSVLQSIDTFKTTFDPTHARLTSYFTDDSAKQTLLVTHQFSKIKSRLKANLVGHDVYPAIITNLQLDLSGRYAFFVVNGQVFRVYIDFLAHSIFSSNEILKMSLILEQKDEFVPLDPTSLLIWRWRNGRRDAVIGESSFYPDGNGKTMLHFYELGCAFGGISDSDGVLRLRLRQYKRFEN